MVAIFSRETQIPQASIRRPIVKGTAMRLIYLAVIILFAAVTLIFALQNFEIVTMSFLGFSARGPLAMQVAIVYLLGAVTGGSLFALLRRFYAGARRNADSLQGRG
jgi:putative membrane protein